jgi:hypothetical protein
MTGGEGVISANSSQMNGNGTPHSAATQQTNKQPRERRLSSVGDVFSGFGGDDAGAADDQTDMKGNPFASR